MRMQTIFLALVTAVFFTGCTTFSLPRNETLTLQSDTSSEAVFQRGAQEFQDLFRDAGWLREAENKSRAQAFMSIIAKGWAGSKNKDKEQPKDAVSLYLARHDAQAGDNRKALAALLISDLDKALIAMSNLNRLAKPLSDTAFPLVQKNMRANVMILERALMSARKAQSLFAGASERISLKLDETEQDDITAQLQTNTQEIERMNILVDALNTLRLSPPPIG